MQKYRYVVLAPPGKSLMILGGLGTTRLSCTRETDRLQASLRY